MKSILKLFLIFFIISIVFFLLYELSGNHFEILFNQKKCIEWFSDIKPFGWGIAILLLISDIFLPVPATGIMAALGVVYGVIPGAIIATIGSTGAGLTGYAAARILGRKKSSIIASDTEIETFKHFFDTFGAYAIILSRAMPLMPEAITILAGISKMNFSKFIAALLAGSFSVSLLFSWLGAVSKPVPGIGILIAVLLPALAWPLFSKMIKI